MELLNATGMQAGYTLGLEPDGRERMVVVIKGTFALPLKENAELSLAPEQIPLVMADEYEGEPGLSAVLYESDFAYFKPRCDVLLNGQAYAPQGREVTRLTVSMAVGSWSKSFDVVGDRWWLQNASSVMPTAPQVFATKPISYAAAFGGVDADPANPENQEAYPQNPIGRGYYPFARQKDLQGKPLPTTEESGNPVTSPVGPFNPMSFGPVGRNFSSRYKFAGTYDQDWIDNVFPFLPADFNPLYFQVAPADQQIAHPQGGELVRLVNLSQAGRISFQLPAIRVPVEFSTRKLERTTQNALLDTILIELDLGRVMLTWRASTPLKKNMLEIAQVVAGRMSPGWYRAREMGKTYYPSLAHLEQETRSQASESEEEA